MATTPTPTRRTSEQQLNQWNQQLRASPIYQQWMQSHGKIDTGRGVRLSEREQDEFERYLKQSGVQIPSGMHIDPGGNLNQSNRLWRNVGIGAAIGGAALTGLGAAGIGPLSGLAGGGAAAGAGGATAGGAGGVLPSASIAGLHTAVPASIASQAASAAIPLATTAGAPLAARHLATRDLMGGPRRIVSEGASRGIPWGGVADVARRGGRGVGDALDAAERMNPLLQSAIAALAGLPALFAKQGPSAEEKALLEQARRMQELQQKRIEHQNPLFEAVTQLAMGRLPGANQRPLQGL